MHAVVLGGVAAIIMDAAAGDDVHVAVLADEKVVIHQIGQPALGEQDGDVDILPLGARLDPDVDAGLVLLGGDLNRLGAPPGVQPAVLADVVGPLGGLFQLGDLLEDLPIYLFHQASPPFI